MKFTALLFLAALAGTLVFAQNATSDPTEAAPAQDPVTSEPDEESASTTAPETTQTAQKTSRVAPRNPRKQATRLLKASIDKGLSLTRNNFEEARKTFEGARKRLHERIKDGEHFIEEPRVQEA
ncbi:extracellular glycoprotein lacritin isoform X2 [Choloepus didactylus]|uniref:extracellular glycoprotein lacritin isoform X2 n=1 Tax=Choloepus didactylus TaxID=27675 RepID=UPI00189D7755|nr:extracellular glycoprotein lacritin isoform X2 [Choloepus didactylus]